MKMESIQFSALEYTYAIKCSLYAIIFDARNCINEVRTLCQFIDLIKCLSVAVNAPIYARCPFKRSQQQIVSIKLHQMRLNPINYTTSKLQIRINGSAAADLSTAIFSALEAVYLASVIFTVVRSSGMVHKCVVYTLLAY